MGQVVRGTVRFFEAVDVPSGATLYVRLLDVTFTDAPSRTVAEQVLALPRGRADERPLAFSLRLETIDPHRTYIVSAHADLDGDGSISRGDWMTMESYPVLTFGHADRVDVVVKKII
jgi:uncharacterized lipoprotein YbaY